MRRAPASSAFSTSSLTTLAGRSTTSPAAMRLTIDSDNWRTGMKFDLIRAQADFIGAAWRPRGKGGSYARYSRLGLPPRRLLMAERCFLPSMRFRFWAFGTLVARRGTGRTAAWRIRSNSRSRASARLRVLVAVALRDDDDDAFLGQPLAGKPHQPHGHVVGQRRRMAHVEAQLHRRRHLVDVLPARPGRAHEAFRQFGVVDRDGVGDAEIVLPSASFIPFVPAQAGTRAILQVGISHWVPAFAGTKRGVRTDQILLRQHLALFHRRLVEGVDAEQDARR